MMTRRRQLIGASKPRRGLGYIRQMLEQFKELARAPQTGTTTIHKHYGGGGGGGGGGALALDDLTDVNAPAPDDNDVLTWDDGAGEWISAAPAGGAGVSDPFEIQYMAHRS